jgi:hypothetical protein
MMMFFLFPSPPNIDACTAHGLVFELGTLLPRSRPFAPLAAQAGGRCGVFHKCACIGPASLSR